MKQDSTFPLSPLVVALLDAPANSRPADIRSAVERAVAAGWIPVTVERAEARALHDEAAPLVADPLTDGQPVDWQWNLAAGLDLLRRVGAGERVHMTDVLHVVSMHLAAHRWHVDHRGVDRFAEIRWRFLELLGRLVMGLVPADWERELMERPAVPPMDETVGQLIRRRRKALGWTQTTLAASVGVSRESVVNWERDRYRPSFGHADGLAAALGGLVADYLA